MLIVTVRIHATGLSARTTRDGCWNAFTKASCTASWASPRLPVSAYAASTNWPLASR